MYRYMRTSIPAALTESAARLTINVAVSCLEDSRFCGRASQGADGYFDAKVQFRPGWWRVVASVKDARARLGVGFGSPTEQFVKISPHGHAIRITVTAEFIQSIVQIVREREYLC